MYASVWLMKKKAQKASGDEHKEYYMPLEDIDAVLKDSSGKYKKPTMIHELYIPDNMIKSGATVGCKEEGRQHKRMLQLMCSFIYTNRGTPGVYCFFEHCIETGSLSKGWRFVIVSYNADITFSGFVGQQIAAWTEMKPQLKAKIRAIGEMTKYMQLSMIGWRVMCEAVCRLSLSHRGDYATEIDAEHPAHPSKILDMKENRVTGAVAMVRKAQCNINNYIDAKTGALHFNKRIRGNMYCPSPSCLDPVHLFARKWPDRRPVVSTTSKEYVQLKSSLRQYRYKQMVKNGNVPEHIQRMTSIKQRIDSIELSDADVKEIKTRYMNNIARTRHAEPESVVETMRDNNKDAIEKLRKRFAADRRRLANATKRKLGEQQLLFEDAKTAEEREEIANAIKAIREEHVRAHGKCLHGYYNALSARRKEALSDFRQVWNESGPLSDSVKSVIIWGNDHVARHERRGHNVFCMHQPKITRDMSFFADTVIRQTSIDEVVHGINRDHMKRCVLRYGELQRFIELDMHTHFMLCGPPGAGKSMFSTLGITEGIPGTTSSTAYHSQAAQFAESGNRMSNLLQLQEEANPSQWGMNTASRKNEEGGGQHGTAHVARMKQVLTRSWTSCYVFISDPDTGARAAKLIEIRANDVWVLCTNQARYKIPRAMIDRFFVVVYDLPNARDVDAVSKIHKPSGPYIEARKVSNIFKCRRDQYIVAMYSQMMEVGLVTAPDLQIPSDMFMRVLQQAHHDAEGGIRGAHNPRHFQRMMNICRTVVMVNAIHLYFDSDLSPCRGTKFSMEHVMALEPLMVGKIEHAVFVMTLMQDMYGERLMFRIMDTLIKNKFGGKRSKFTPVRRSEPLKRPKGLMRRVGEEKKAKYNKYDHNLDYTAFQIFSKPLEGHEAMQIFIDKIADFPCIKNMSPQSSRDNIVATLWSMTKQRNGVPSIYDPQRSIPLLKLDGVNACLSIKALEALREDNMATYTKVALQYKGAPADKYLCGSSQHGLDSNLKTITIKECKACKAELHDKEAKKCNRHKFAYVRNASYIDPSIDKILKGSDVEWDEKSQGIVEATEARAFSRLFATEERYRVTPRWERQSQLNRFYETGWDSKMLKKWYTNPRSKTVLSVFRDENRDRMVRLYEEKGIATKKGKKHPLCDYAQYKASRLLGTKQRRRKRVVGHMDNDLSKLVDTGLLDPNLPYAKQLRPKHTRRRTRERKMQSPARPMQRSRLSSAMSRRASSSASRVDFTDLKGSSLASSCHNDLAKQLAPSLTGRFVYAYSPKRGPKVPRMTRLPAHVTDKDVERVRTQFGEFRTYEQHRRLSEQGK